MLYLVVNQFPFDFFAEILYPKRIIDSYEWTFKLAPQKQPTPEELIRDAEKLKSQLSTEDSID